MKKKLFLGAALGFSLLLGSNQAQAINPETQALLDMLQNKGVIAEEEAESFRVKIEEEIHGKEVGAHEESLLGKINERVTLSGVVEVEATSAEDFEGVDTSDITLATVELGLDAEITEWVNAHLLLLWEEDEGPLDLDEGTITLGNLEKFPLYLTVGKMYVPFGYFESNMISDPLTLELSETRESAALVGFEASGFYGSVYAFNSDINEGDDDKIASFGANAGYGYENDDMVLDLDIGWINNMAAVDNLGGYFDDADIAEVQDYAAGITASLTVNYGPFMLIGGYLGALDTIDANELTFNGRGAEPSAWNFEVAYTREIKGKETTFAVGYQKTDEALALELPEERILGSIGVEIWENTSLALEYLHDKDYSVADGGTGNDANAVTLQLAVEF